MSRILLILCICSIGLTLDAQFDQITNEEKYTHQVYYSLSEEGTLNSVEHGVWDIAFTTQGVQDAGIFVNEGASLVDVQQVELYFTGLTDFDQSIVIDTAAWTRLYNPEVDWQNGAFNSLKDPTNAFDFGWGIYNPGIFTVEGKYVFVVKLRNGEWKKIFIESLLFEWIFKHANLDGSDEVNQIISKMDHPNRVLAYYSIQNEEVVDIEPMEWDLLFTRYNTYTDDGNGNFLDYVVTGVLSGLDVKVAQYDDVNPNNLEFDDVDDEDYEDELDIIGFDWKEVDINSATYTVKDDLVYFVLKADETVCKLEFIDFEGSSTGTTTIKRECRIIAPIKDIQINGLNSARVFPNPCTDNINLLLDIDKKMDTKLSLFDMNGSLLNTYSHSFEPGLKHKQLPINLKNGQYNLVIEASGSVHSLPIIVAK